MLQHVQEIRTYSEVCVCARVCACACVECVIETEER